MKSASASLHWNVETADPFALASLPLSIRKGLAVQAAVEMGTIKSKSCKFLIEDSAHWYDLSVSCDKRNGFLRRFAGRVETGKHSLSDPMMGTD